MARSGFEKSVLTQLNTLKMNYKYEGDKIDYVENKTYIPDITFTKKNGEKMFIELKGQFKPEDRRKHKILRETKPELDIRILFQNPFVKIRKGSKTNYSAWCEKNNIPWGVWPLPYGWRDEII